ncbi:MAG TPA: FAD:protein FMN transferase [Longimicrobiales bacterium]|nr:FAD:protein FMN transferase [Longimicrobiales bacterium]
MEAWGFDGLYMGTEVRLTLWGPDSVAAASAARRAMDEIGRLDSIFSDYRSDSEIAGLAAAAPEAVPVSEALMDVLTRAAEWSNRSGGAFDVTAGPLTRLWRWSARRGELPAPARLREALDLTGTEGLDLEPSRGRARLARAGMSIDLGGIAKGWTADHVLSVLREDGFPVAVADLGGDVALGDTPPGREGWRVDLPGGGATLGAGRAVATSGDEARQLVVGGVRYSHVVDPSTGLGVVDAPTVVVVAPDATTADVLASILTVLPEVWGRDLAEATPGVAVRVLHPDGSSWETNDFPRPHRRPPPDVP